MTSGSRSEEQRKNSTSSTFELSLLSKEMLSGISRTPFRLPYAIYGTVVHGYGRGGRELDCPTGCYRFL